MHFQQLSGVCLLAFASFSWAEAVPRHYLWGADGMGKMVVKRATSKTSSTSIKTTAKSSSSTTKPSSTVKSSSSSVVVASSKASSSSIASSSSASSASSSTSLVADASCTNGPNSRACWNNGYSIKTDFDQKHPTTGNTVTYNLEIQNTTCSPDGNGMQPCYLINGQYPGPTLFGNWGDTFVINVKNSLQDNGTGMHFHGIRQLNSVNSDGVSGITECPIPPGATRTYSFIASQFGTSWYHSHYSSQYGMGITGQIQINGPASANYDIDLGTFPINDWYYPGAEQINEDTLVNLQTQNPPPAGDNILINGTGVSANGGQYAQVNNLVKNKRYRLRLINTSVDNALRVKLDNHNFTVISADFIPTVAQAGQDWLLLGVGQRHDVIFTANQAAGSYWFRAEAAGPADECFSGNTGHGRALFTYSGQTPNTALPDSNEAPPKNGCKELVTVPYWNQAVDSSNFASQIQSMSTGVSYVSSKNLALWNLDTTSMAVSWDKPTLQYIMEGNTSYPDPYTVINLPNEGIWVYFIIQMTSNSPPLTGVAQFNAASDTANLNFANPPRRDTSILPGQGWLAIAFETNNPGAWLMHCHIAWHISEGLGVQFVESVNQIKLPDSSTFKSQCDAWRQYSPTMRYPQIDSGL